MRGSLTRFFTIEDFATGAFEVNVADDRFERQAYEIDERVIGRRFPSGISPRIVEIIHCRPQSCIRRSTFWSLSERSVSFPNPPPQPNYLPLHFIQMYITVRAGRFPEFTLGVMVKGAEGFE